MVTKINLLIISVLSIVLLSCEEILEIDISEELVVLIAPSNGVNTSETSHTFFWEEVDGATSYNLQIVSTGFANIEKFVMDTNIVSNSFFLSLPSGDYEWRVQGKNNGSNTEYTTFSFSNNVTDIDISGIDPVLMAPSNGLVTTDTIQTFYWEEIEGADNYEIQVVRPDFSNIEKFVVDTNVTSNSVLLTLSVNEFEWRVRGLNSSSETNYSIFSFKIESTK